MIPVPRPEPANATLAAALAAAAAAIPPAVVDQVWVFPPHARGPRETGLAVLATFAEGDRADARRTIHTVRYEAEAAGGQVTRSDVVTEEGTVPADRLDRLVDGIVRRLGGGLETPEVREVGGDAAAWEALLADLSGSVDGS